MNPNTTLTRIEVAHLEGRRPRNAGSNARLGEHGQAVRPRLARIFTQDGCSGFGATYAGPEALQRLLGLPLESLFDPESGATGAGQPIDFPLWDLMGNREGQPAYRLAARMFDREAEEPFRVRCYDTSLYFDDLHLDSIQAAAECLASEARDGYARGHRAFKIKVGRGARHQPLEEGTQRDVAIVRAVHEAVGPGCLLMLDANNGYNLNLTKRVLSETADCGVFWMEEAFHEDSVLYRDLKDWLDERNLDVKIADGEGGASPRLMDWAREGLVDVVQYDIVGHGFTRWLKTGRQLDEWGRGTAPHHYGGHYGNYVSGHLAGAIQGFTYVEWDEATTDGLNADAYHLDEGWLTPPDAPGFGLALDETEFQSARESNGFTLKV